MKGHRQLWILFAAGAFMVLVALGWVTVRVLDLESREAVARADAQHQEALRLALWRMDSWFAPRLAREAARPYFEYLPYYPQQRAYTRILNRIEQGEVLTPSPLLTFESDYFPVHFQLNADGSVTSPQVPTDSQRDLAESTLLSGEQIAAHEAALGKISQLLSHAALVQRVAPAEQRITALTCDVDNQPPAQAASPLVQTDPDESNEGIPAVANASPGGQRGAPYQGKSQTMLTQEEQAQRWMSSNMAQRAEMPQQQRGILNDQQTIEGLPKGAQLEMNDTLSMPEPRVVVGPLVPLWIENNARSDGSPAQRELVFVRRVSAGEQECFQGFVGKWPRIEQDLLGQISGLLGQARLQVLDASPLPEHSTGTELTTVPAKLVASKAALPAIGLATPARVTMGIAWLAVLAAIVAAGITLRASIHFGEKRSRFASAVTHELRTPLTTFRMYSEMLAEGMIRDESQRRSYLETLKSESARLATLVENVLSYARLEEGRFASHAQRTTLRDMISRLVPILHRRASDAGMELAVIVNGQSHRFIDDLALHRSPSSEEAHSLTRSSPEDSGLSIDTEAVGQILFNLVDNACKYANGTANRTIHIDAAKRNGHIIIHVRDHGPGISAEHAREVFAPFERGAHKAGDTIPGVGLGLALSRGLARDLGGDLELNRPPTVRNPRESLESTGSECGACFVLTLPCIADSGNR